MPLIPISVVPTAHGVMAALSVGCWAALAVEDSRRGSVPLWLVLVFLALCGGVLITGSWQFPQMLISPVASFGFFGLAFVLARGKMGGSDVLVATGLSVFVAWYDLPYAWVGASVAGVAFIALKSLVLKNRGVLRARAPFIPFLGLGHFGWALCLKTFS